MDDDDDLGICGRCLIVPDSRTMIRARFRDRIEPCEYSTDPVMLKKWAEKQLYLEMCLDIEVNDTINRFRAISTWHGDPVCSWHLWILADAEMKSGYGARALRAR